MSKTYKGYYKFMAMDVELPEPKDEVEARRILPYKVAIDLLNGMSIKEVAFNWHVTRMDVIRYYRQVMNRMTFWFRQDEALNDIRDNVEMGRCSFPECGNLVMRVNSGDTVYCPKHSPAENKVQMMLRDERRWSKLKELEFGSLLEFIIVSYIHRRPDIVCAYFLDDVIDAGKLATEYGVTVYEAEDVVVDAGFIIEKVLDRGKQEWNKRFERVKRYWAFKHKGLLDEMKGRGDISE